MKATNVEQNWKLVTPPAYFWLALWQVREFAMVRGLKDFQEGCCRPSRMGSFVYSMNIIDDYLLVFKEENPKAYIREQNAIDWELPR